MPLLSQARTNPSASPTIRCPFLIGGESLLPPQPSPKKKIPRASRREEDAIVQPKRHLEGRPPNEHPFPPYSSFGSFTLLFCWFQSRTKTGIYRCFVYQLVTFLFLISSQKIFIVDKIAGKCRRTFQNSFQRALQESFFYFFYFFFH